MAESAASADKSLAPALQRMAQFATSASIRDFPAAVVEKAKVCILDAISGCFSIAGDARPQAALRSVVIDAPSSTARVVGTSHRASAADAAFVNGVATACTDRSDTHTATATHPGAVVIPAALAVAQQRGLSGAALIEAVVVGYETMARLALAMITPEIVETFRSSGLTGPTGAAFAAARALGLDERTATSAASLAAQTSSGLNAWAYAGTDEHAFHIGFAARSGVLSSLLASNGVVAAPTALDGRAGLLAGFGAQAKSRLLTAGLNERYEILGVAYKPAPACYFAQSPAQAAATLAGRSIDVADVISIEARVSDAAARFPGCDNAGPMRSRQDAAMSIQFCVAAVLMRGAIDETSWARFASPDINDLARRVNVVIDTDFSRASPAKQGVRLTAKLRDGRAVESDQDDLRSMIPAEVMERFIQAAEATLPSPRRHEFIDAIMALDALENVNDAFRLVAAD